jgi:NADH dehydrogenase
MQEKNTRDETVVITGAFSYTGQYATKLLLNRGYKVRTLTSHPGRENPFGERVEVFTYQFDHPERLTQTLRGASTLINTYWVRFPRGKTTFETAVHNTRILLATAKCAGVRRIVHVSIASPSLQSPLGYYRGKAQLEQVVIESGLSHAIVRPTVIYGLEDILINNIAWFIRQFPVFAVPGDGRYSVRPIFVEDMARLMVEAVGREENTVFDAVGPETFTFEELVRLIAAEVGRPVRIVHVPAHLAYLCTRLTGLMMRDTVLTWEEYKGFMSNLLAPQGRPTGETCLSQWLSENREQIGRHYASEVARHYAVPA